MMINLRAVVTAAVLSLLSLTADAQDTAVARTSPAYNYAFHYPLPIPATKKPAATYTNPKTGTPIDFYQVEMKPFSKKIFPNLGAASLVGYDGQVPGPTFRVERGRETVVRFINKGFRPSAIHLHGSYTRTPWDGWANDIIAPGSYKDYYYPNQQNARPMWYHDHVAMQTALNIYAGQSGLYIVQDSALEQKLALPQGAYDVPLILNSMYFTKTGNISDETAERTSTYGDTFLVNGQIQPFLAVEPRKYRFRVLDASVSRSFNLTVQADGSKKVAPMYVVASDSGFLPKPVKTNNLIISMAERWEVVIDFAAFKGQNLTLTQSNLWVDTAYAGTDAVLQFRVGRTVSSSASNGALPSTLVAPAATAAATTSRTFTFARSIGLGWTINGALFTNAASRILAAPPLGTTEKWTLSGAAGWSHPVHAHLIDFTLLSRTTSDLNRRPGRDRLEAYEVGALKDIAVLGENEVVEVLARFAPWTGVYTFHCHNAVHEDYAMMGAFNVSMLAGFGYPPEVARLEDPMDPRWTARRWDGVGVAPVKVMGAFAALGAYEKIAEIERGLRSVWAKGTKTTGVPKPTATGKGRARSDGRCGKDFGGATCDPAGGYGKCCSSVGWCGNTVQHCSVKEGCQNGCSAA
ncbi:Cupredoxin [Geopyxis carbonaria]|nr:Cupredoxin [Geopyxis carbonaria]